jgi:hypothetical protein
MTKEARTIDVDMPSGRLSREAPIRLTDDHSRPLRILNRRNP